MTEGHGTFAAYNRGCRCEACAGHRRDYDRRRYDRLATSRFRRLLAALPDDPWVGDGDRCYDRDRCYACDATDEHADDCPWVAADAIRRGR